VSLWGSIDYSVDSSVTSNKPLLQSEGNETTASNRSARGSKGGPWPQLTGAKEEIDSIAVLLSEAGIANSSNTGAFATEKAFKALNGNSPQVIHLATHGFFMLRVDSSNTGTANRFQLQQDPMLRSGLVLAGANQEFESRERKENGILTAYEIAQIDLSNTQLVVLSACETALGEVEGNEGVIGLQRAFKIAGVKQMIISLWLVPDKETKELMMIFYKNWLSGQSTRQALRSAQLKMKEKENSSPYSWAAFVLVE
jgi:CHAT domain-containing protein